MAAETSLKRVLVVDDDDNILAQAKKALKRAGCTVIETCASARAATQLLATQDFDLALVDLRMPEVSGSAWVQSLLAQRDSQKRSISIIAMYGMISKEEVFLLSELGLTEHLRKPFTDEHLLERIQEIEEKRRDPSKDPDKTFQLAFSNALKLRQYKQAESLIIPRLKKEPQSPRFLANYGEILFRSGKVDEAEKFIRKALALNPSYIPALNILSKVHVRSGQYDAALAALDKAQSLSPMNVDRLLVMGEMNLAVGRADVSEHNFRSALTLNPDEQRATLGLGRALVSQGKIEESKKLFEGVGDISQLATYFNNKGILLVRAERFDEGISLYENALKVLEQKHKTYLLIYNIALAYFRQGNGQQAALYAEKAKKAAPAGYDKPMRLLEKIKAEGAPQSVPPALAAAPGAFLATAEQMDFIMGGFDLPPEDTPNKSAQQAGPSVAEDTEFIMFGFENIEEPEESAEKSKEEKAEPPDGDFFIFDS